MTNSHRDPTSTTTTHRREMGNSNATFRDRDFEDMRYSLGVVTSLFLVALTYAAKFTKSHGSFLDVTGAATAVTSAAYSVFLVANKSAICCCFLALFCLIWSIGNNAHTSAKLIRGSMMALMPALVGMMVAYTARIFSFIVPVYL